MLMRQLRASAPAALSRVILVPTRYGGVFERECVCIAGTLHCSPDALPWARGEGWVARPLPKAYVTLPLFNT